MRRLLLALTLILTLAAHRPAAAQGSFPAVQKAVGWMQQQQQPDGSFPGFGPGDTADAVVALVAAGADLESLAKDGKTPLSYLEGQAATYAATGPGAAAKLAMAAVASGADPASFGGVNLLEQIGKSYDAATGQYGPDVYGHALALLGVKGVGADAPDAAVARLVGLQLEDGGWSFDGSKETGSDTNTTSLAVQALVGEGQADAAVDKALAYLKGQQNDDGGFPYSQTSQFGNASDANSTAAVIQAVVAAGQDPASAEWAGSAGAPLDALAAFQNESGALRYQEAQADDNAVATYQAIPALLGKALPVATRAVSGAQAAIEPAAQPAAGLPATGDPAETPLVALVLAALALAGAGTALRRRAAL